MNEKKKKSKITILILYVFQNVQPTPLGSTVRPRAIAMTTRRVTMLQDIVQRESVILAGTGRVALIVSIYILAYIC